MALDLLLKEAQDLSEDSLMEVVRFVRFIKLESQQSEEVSSGTGHRRLRMAGKYRNQIWMSDDFDAPLREFEEYR